MTKYIKFLLYISSKNAEAARILATIPARERADYICSLIIADKTTDQTKALKASLKAALIRLEAEEIEKP